MIKQAPHGNRSLKSIASILLVSFLDAAISHAQEPSQWDVYVTVGEELAMCQQIAQELRDKRGSTTSYCGIPIPENDPDYELPDWVALDVLENIEILQKSYFWHNMWVSKAHPLYEKQLADRSVILPEFLEIYWTKALPVIMEMIAKDEIELWGAKLDIDADGVEESVYKVTTINTPGIRQAPWNVDIKPPFVRGHCEDIGFQDSKKEYLYYVDPEELPGYDYGGLFFPSHLVINGFVTWQGNLYWSGGRIAMVIPTKEYSVALPQACAIRSIRRRAR